MGERYNGGSGTSEYTPGRLIRIPAGRGDKSPPPEIRENIGFCIIGFCLASSLSRGERLHPRAFSLSPLLFLSSFLSFSLDLARRREFLSRGEQLFPLTGDGLLGEKPRLARLPTVSLLSARSFRPSPPPSPTIYAL